MSGKVCYICLVICCFLLRDNDNVKKYFCAMKYTLYSKYCAKIMTVEIWAFLKGFQVAWAKGLRRAELELDLESSL